VAQVEIAVVGDRNDGCRIGDREARRVEDVVAGLIVVLLRVDRLRFHAHWVVVEENGDRIRRIRFGDLIDDEMRACRIVGRAIAGLRKCLWADVFRLRFPDGVRNRTAGADSAVRNEQCEADYSK
jgi:hypothetical protein